MPDEDSRYKSKYKLRYRWKSGLHTNAATWKWWRPASCLWPSHSSDQDTYIHCPVKMVNTNIFKVKCLYLGFLCLSYKPYNHPEKNRRYIGHLTYTAMSQLSLVIFDMCIHYVCCKAPTYLHEELPLVCHPILFLPLGFNFSLLSLKVKWIPLHLQSKFDKSESRFPLEKMILHLYKPRWVVHHIILLLVVSYHCWYDNWRGAELPPLCGRHGTLTGCAWDLRHWF